MDRNLIREIIEDSILADNPGATLIKAAYAKVEMKCTKGADWEFCCMDMENKDYNVIYIKEGNTITYGYRK